MGTHSLRDELAALEGFSPTLKAAYERRVREMVERQITAGQRAIWSLVALLSTGLFLGFGYLGLSGIRGMPWEARAGFLAGSLFALAFAVLGGLIVARGRYRPKAHSAIYHGLAWGVTLVTFVLAFQLAPRVTDPYRGTQMMLLSVGFLVMGLGFLLKNVTEQAALKTQEEMLRLQIQIAELAERLERSQNADTPA
jgi:hypothetical protein